MARPTTPGLRRWNGLMQRAREPLLLLDAQARILFANRAWEALTGCSAEDMVGRPCRGPTTPPEGDLDALAASFAPPPEAMAGRPAASPCPIVHADGRRSLKRVDFLPLHDGEGRLLGLMGVVRDPHDPSMTPMAGSRQARSELLGIRETLRDRHATEALIGRGPRHDRLLGQVAAAGVASSPALIVGEPGTGKRQVARAIHARGASAGAPLIPLDAGVLPPEVVAAELFGPEADGPDRLIAPGRATILLANVADLPRDIQARLARALTGSATRLLATTTVDPELSLRQERLRDDLYFAMTVLVLRLAPLRERLEELPILAQHFLERAIARTSVPRSGFSPEAMAVFASYDWPGNLRELARVVDWAQERAAGDLISADDLPASIRGELASAYVPPPMPPPSMPLDQWLAQVERRLIEQALRRAGNNRSRAADLLQISRPRLYRRIKELDIPEEPEGGAGPAS